MRDVVNVEAARRHVGGDQNFQRIGAEAPEDAFAGILFEVAVERLGRETAQGQFAGKTRRLSAGAGKDQRAGDRFHLEEIRQRVQLVRFVDKVVALFGGLDGHRLAFNGDSLRVPHEASGEGADACGQGCAEEGGLPFGRRRGQNRFDRFDEAHVEHLVGFI